MALWCENTYLSVWKVETDGDKVYARFSSSSKNKEGNYEQDLFVPRALVVGEAKDVLPSPFDADNNNNKPLFIKATTKTTNKYDKEKNKTFWNVMIAKAEDCSSLNNSEDNAGESESDNDVSEDNDAPW